MIMSILRTIASGLWPVIFLVIAIGLFGTLFAGPDLLTQDIASYAFDADLHYTGLGIVVLLIVALILGLLKKIKINDVPISFGTLVGLIVRGKLKRVLNSPLVEVEIYPGVFYRGWLVDIVNEVIEQPDGTAKNLVAYYCFLPSGNNPTSGQMPRVSVERIKYILRRPSGHLLANVFSFGSTPNNWNKIEFIPEDYPPHNPKEVDEE